VIEGKAAADLREVTSYEGFYGGFLSTGEVIRASGKLERVVDRRSGEEYHRILVGSPEAGGRDYVLPRSLLGDRD
jgi:predicted nucleotidyltransferase